MVIVKDAKLDIVFLNPPLLTVLRKTKQEKKEISKENFLRIPSISIRRGGYLVLFFYTKRRVISENVLIVFSLLAIKGFGM